MVGTGFLCCPVYGVLFKIGEGRMMRFSIQKARIALRIFSALGLRFYIEVARTAFRRQLIYRWANLAGLLTNVFFSCIISYLMIALYHARPSTAGYNIHDTLRYIWLVQSMTMVVLTFGWYDLMLTIRTGEVVSDLSKPCDFYWYWFSREIGRSFYYLLYRGLPTYLAGMLLFRFGAPLDWHPWLPFALSLPVGAMIGIAYRMLFNLAAFWILEARAFGTLATVIALVFTGSYVPLPFFPTWLRAIADWLPFRSEEHTSELQSQFHL